MFWTTLQLKLMVSLTVVLGQHLLPPPDKELQPQFDRVAARIEAGDWNGAWRTLNEIPGTGEFWKDHTAQWIHHRFSSALYHGAPRPSHMEARAAIAAELGLYDVALDYAKKRIQLLERKGESDSHVSEARLDLAKIAQTAGAVAAQRGDFKAAKKYYTTLTECGGGWMKELGTEKVQLLDQLAQDPYGVEARIKFATAFWTSRTTGARREAPTAIRLLEDTLDTCRPISIEQRKRICSTIWELADRKQKAVWADRILKEFPDDEDLVAKVRSERADLAYRDGDIDAAFRDYRYVSEHLPNSASYGVAQFNVGMILKGQGRYAEAIAEFKHLFPSNVNDLDPTGHIMVEYRNYRPRAQWEIGNCYRAMGRYREAFEAYSDTETKYPFRSGCGNAHAEFRYRYALYKGLCLELMGNPYAASIFYWGQLVDGMGLYYSPTIPMRLLDLYDTAGQVDTLLGILDAADVRLQKRVERQLKRPLDAEMKERIKVGRTIHEVLRIRELARRHRWADLIDLLKIKGTVAGPEEPYARKGNWQAVEAAKGLARVPAQTVPLLIRAFGKSKGADGKWVYYALGLCGTKRALDFLEQRWQTEENCWRLNTIVYSVSVAGKPGMARLQRMSRDRLRGGAVRSLREGRFDDQSDFEFPQLPPRLTLPQSLGEILTARATRDMLDGKPLRPPW